MRLPGIEAQRGRDGLEIQLLPDHAQQELWNQFVREEPYLENARLVGGQRRYAVRYEGQWLAWLGWSAPAGHLQAREAWIHGSADQGRRRLPLLAPNSRFVMLAARTPLPNLGTRALRLCLDRLSEDWRAQHGHPILAVESFVEAQLFRGTVDKASNWTMRGPTAGLGRV